jgi:(1->4)-alpha-D-glucan 1-alpha-D-glucosylmutase
VETGCAQALAFARSGEVVTVVSRLTASSRDGWGEATVALPEGRWRDELTGTTYGARAPLRDVLAELPVALLVRQP